ncbi:MAG: TetR/AcrR family transcriptional regulator [bacterium]|nr:TetR/AcrR family transcriptional regulator [bacterium]
MSHSEARERVLQAAEQLFSERGYTAVTIKDIAIAAGIHHASLYHHAPGGKEQLYIEVTTRMLERHRQGIANAIQDGGIDLRNQLHKIAIWFLSHPPMDMIRMVHSDISAIEATSAHQLLYLAFDAILVQLEGILRQAQNRGEIRSYHIGTMAGALFSAIQGLHTLPEAYLEKPRQEMADEIIDMFIAGMKHS